MEGALLNFFGRNNGLLSHHSCLQASLTDIDKQLAFLQANALDRSTIHSYSVGARDYLHFCLTHDLPLHPTPLTLAQYNVYTSCFIASGPRYLSGAWHYLQDLFPEYDSICNHPLVTSTFRGSKKVHADPVWQKQPLWTSISGYCITLPVLWQFAVYYHFILCFLHLSSHWRTCSGLSSSFILVENYQTGHFVLLRQQGLILLAIP